MSLLLTALATLPFLVIPGLAGGAWATSFSPGPARSGALLARSLACAVAVWLLASGLLSRTVGLSSTSVWVTAGVLTAAGIAVLALARTRAALRDGWSDLGYLAALTVASYLVWLPVGIFVVATTWAPLGSTPWYYWGLAEQVAAAGHIPATSWEWGTTVPFLADYRLFSAATAALIVVGDGLPAAQFVGVLAVLLLGSGAALLARALGAGPVASLAAVPFAVGTGIGALRLTAYRPEAWGIGLLLLLVALAVDWLRYADRGSLAVAVALAACLSQVHGIALLSAGALIVAAALSLLREGARRILRRLLAVAAAMAGAVVLLGVVLGGMAGAVHSGGLVDIAGVADPTWEFIRASAGNPTSPPPGNLELAGDALRNAYATNRWVITIAVVVSVVVLGAAAVRGGGSREARRFLAFTGLACLGLTLLAAVFALGWSGYVPRRMGASRLVLEATLLVGPLVAGALSATLSAGSGPSRWAGWQGLWSVGRWPAWQHRAFVAAVFLAVGSVGWAGSSRIASAAGPDRPDPATMAALADLPIPEDAVVLANGYTEGYLRQVTGARGLLEGRAPYTFPDLLDRANSLLRDARRFYARPRRHVDFLDEHDVSYVVAGTRRSYSLGTPRVLAGGRRLSRLVPERLEPVLRRPGLRVYRVVAAEDSASAESALLR